MSESDVISDRRASGGAGESSLGLRASGGRFNLFTTCHKADKPETQSRESPAVSRRELKLCQSWQKWGGVCWQSWYV